MEEREGKTWEGTAGDLYNRLKEIIGEATGAEQTDEQPRLDIRDHPPEETRRHPTHGDLSWLAVQEKCFGSPSVCASGRPSSAIPLRICIVPRPGT